MLHQVFYLINKGFESIFGVTQRDTILEESDFNKILKKKDNIKAIVILAELEWNRKRLTDFYGFEIALELRRKYKLLCPLIITSILGLSYFEKLAETQIKFKILFGRGTAFLQIDENMNRKIEDSITTLNQYPLSTAVLTDMNEMLLDQKGFIIDKLTHDLKFDKKKQETETVLNETSEYLNSQQFSTLSWNAFKSRLLKNLNNSTNFGKVKEALILKCGQELRGEKVSGTSPEKKHKIIVLEDDPGFRKTIQENLKDYFKEVIVKEKAEDVIVELNKDETNAITGIIADWRLFKDFSKKMYWQLQGYEVLDYAAKKRFIALFSLTSLHDRNVNNIRNALGLEIHLFKKQHLELEGKAQWEMMADTIRQKCDLITYLIASQPTGMRWETDYYDRSRNRIIIKPLKIKYIEKRNCSSWKVYEDEVSKKSTDLWDYYNKVLNDETFDISTFESIKAKFGYQIAAKEPDLKDILIVRRIYLALLLSVEKIHHSFYRILWESIIDRKVTNKREENPLVNVYCVLNGTNWEEFNKKFKPVQDKRKGKFTINKKGEKEGGMIMTPEEQASEDILAKSKLFANWLCITTKSLPGKGILPEEQNWLLSIGIDTSKGNSVFDYKAIEDDSDEETN